MQKTLPICKIGLGEIFLVVSHTMTNTVTPIHQVKHRQLKCLGHILRMSKEKPARRYALYIQTIGKRRPGRPRTSYLTHVQRLFGDYEGAMQELQIATLADDCRVWRNIVVTCSAADGWWWWCTQVGLPLKCCKKTTSKAKSSLVNECPTLLSSIWQV